MRMLFSIAVVGFSSILAYAYYMLWWRHQKMRERLRRQGIKGPHHSFLYGSIPEMKRIVSLVKEKQPTTCNVRHNYSSTLFPYFDRWREQYGNYKRRQFFPEHPSTFCSFYYFCFCCLIS